MECLPPRCDTREQRYCLLYADDQQDQKEGMGAFVEKRKPKFTHE